ncbi:phenoloxidase-activating factor 2-like isoform X2 [Homalodisca vitripennis]|uniref:phenoloxidase-activating factor 2-like isoform X2 n=1 Tax=Homalodisca vitripennis TaxID=197043 RepID=UPI001EECB46F|nr:phenoloxidase-activating factor 2-like isoform X2 [Homalodisca vitripennis]
MMWFLSAILMSAVSLCLAQSGGKCTCIPYFYCNNTSTDNGECESFHEVCCEDGEGGGPPTPDGGGICGIRGKRKDASGVDVDWKLFDSLGDTSTTFGEFPWMVAILKVGPSGSQEFLCGGSIIYPNIILTTAHTISGLSAVDLRVKAGVWNTTNILESDKHQDRTVAATVLHSGYDKSKVQNDVALLVLNDPLEITDNVAPVCLPSRDTIFNSTDCIATGWGVGNFGNKGIGSVLRMVHLPLVDSNKCQEEFRKVPRLGPNFNLHSSFICAGRDLADTCTGDGGGPLVCPLLDDSGKYVQIGITSWGIGCGDLPGAYSSVIAAREWIDTMSDAFPATSPRQSL